MTLLPILFGIAFVAGLRLKLLAIIALVAIVMAPIGWMYALQAYQKVAHLRPSSIRRRTARGAGYQQLQARITVGSGGLSGKGFRHGTQGQYRFLP